MKRKPWLSPMALAAYQTQADALILAHAERTLVTSTMLQALVEKDPDKWGKLVEKMQDVIAKAYESHSLVTLSGALTLAEKTYADLDRQYRQ